MLVIVPSSNLGNLHIFFLMLGHVLVGVIRNVANFYPFFCFMCDFRC